jgi:hypothetical protein
MTTSANNLQGTPYLKTQWQFPYDDLRGLSHQVDIAYIDIATKVNSRTIGTYANNYPIVTGERWYLSGSSTGEQTLRQVYQFTGAGSIPHGINFASITLITHKCYGSYTDNADITMGNWYGVIYANSTGIAGQVTFYVTPKNIVVTVDAAAQPVVSGIIVLEWLSQF